MMIILFNVDIFPIIFPMPLKPRNLSDDSRFFMTTGLDRPVVNGVVGRRTVLLSTLTWFLSVPRLGPLQSRASPTRWAYRGIANIGGGANKVFIIVIGLHPQGTHGDQFIDIRNLSTHTGMFAFDPGFSCTASCSSAITYIDGPKGTSSCWAFTYRRPSGTLLYRGYPAADLAEHSDFCEVCFLLLNGNLPSRTQYKK